MMLNPDNANLSYNIKFNSAKVQEIILTTAVCTYAPWI